MFDVIIIGAGSAGYPAGMYASRYKLKNLIIGGMAGGALATSHKVENYPGTISAPGAEIMKNFEAHAIESGSEIVADMVTKIEKLGEFHFKLTTGLNKTFETKFVIIATGNNYKKLGVKGENELLGKGVSYCATCDGNFFKNLDVVVVGGGNTALTETIYLAELCKKVYLVHRSDTFKAEDIWVEQASKHSNIEFVLNEEVEEIVGGFFGVEQIKLKSGKSIKAEGIFVAIGSNPNSALASDLGLELDNEGCIVVDKTQATSMKGIYAAGDITTNSNKFRQTIMSAREGCLAANSVHEEMIKMS